MVNTPLLSICIPTYNRARLLDICLDSMLDQVRACQEDIEVLISNNASTDNTREVVEMFLNIYPELRYTENDFNRGMDFNIAQCFELARAEYVWIFSDDDLLLPRAIERIVPLLKTQNLGIITLAVNFYPCKGSIDKTLFPYEPLSYKLYYDPRKLACEVHFWLTYITGVIVNKRIATQSGIYYPSGESLLIHLGWVFPALFSQWPSAKIDTALILGRALEVLDFKPFAIFGMNYPSVLKELSSHKVLPLDVKEMLVELIITKYFAPYIHPRYTHHHGEHPLLILGKSFWNRKSFWVHLFPRFIYRALHKILIKTNIPLSSKINSLKTRLIISLNK